MSVGENTDHSLDKPGNDESLATRLRRIVIDPIRQSLIGKDEIVEVLAVTLVAGENAFLLGPPGTGKSALVQEFAARIRGNAFDYLLTRFTEPSELFGPFDLRRLRDGDLVTNTDGMLPEADLVFLDELFNANSAILNGLLLALNERVFRRGRETTKLPMLMAVGASNQLPDDEALAALYDRFLLRVRCDNVEPSRLSEVLQAGWQRFSSSIDQQMTIEDVRQLQSRINRIDLSDVSQAFLSFVGRLRESGLPISDRRAVRLQRVIAASAVLSGRERASVSDLWVLQYSWETPAQIEMLAAHFDSVRQEYENTEELAPSTDSSSHPMADKGKAPDPNAIARMVEKIRSNPDHHESALDALTLLSARAHWIADATPREDVLRQIEEARSQITNAEKQTESGDG